MFKYRTGTWTINSADQRLGHNYVRVYHQIGATEYDTNYFEWVNDTNTDALSASGGVLNTLAMTGSRFLSGVEYHTGGSAKYSVTISNAYRNVYSTSASAITYTVSGGSISPEALPSMTTAADDVVLTNKNLSITSTRILNGSISAAVNCHHPLKSNLGNGESKSISGLLLDSIVTPSTAIVESFNSENIRLQSVGNVAVNGYDDQADITTGAWDSGEDLGGANTGHNDGLLYYSSTVRYPTMGANSGNFGAITNGPTGNPDYSILSGTRSVYIKFQNNTGSARSNFRLSLAGTSTSFIAASSAPSGNNVTLEMKFPEGSISTRTGWMDCYNDFATGQWNDGNGCRNATDGAGRALSTNWGITVGTKSIANNEYIIIRLRAAAVWSGNLSSVTLTWL